MRVRASRWLCLGIVLWAAAAAAPAEAQPVLDREFTVGPRLGLVVFAFDDEVQSPGFDIGVDMRKELGATVMRFSASLQYATEDVFAISMDAGPGFFLTRGTTAPWLGFDVGLRLGPGAENGSEMPVGVGAFLAGGIVFRRDQSTRIHLDLHVGASYMTIGTSYAAELGYVSRPSRSSMFLSEGRLSASVGF